MTLLACVDDRMGLMFNRRRQSRDKAVIGNIAEEVGEAPLYVTPYTAKLFYELYGSAVAAMRISAVPGCLAQRGEFYFMENAELVPEESQIERIILYRWNRSYPFDKTFPINLDNGHWELSSVKEFCGTSHEKITKEVYVYHA